MFALSGVLIAAAVVHAAAPVQTVIVPIPRVTTVSMPQATAEAEPEPEPVAPAEPTPAAEDPGPPDVEYEPALVLAAGPSEPALTRPAKPFSVADGGIVLPGGAYEARAEAAFELDGRPTLVAVGASWCAPCVAELPELLEVAGALHETFGTRVVFASVDGSHDAAGLALEVASFFHKAGAGAPPEWIEFRADPKWAWAALAAPLAGPDGGLREYGVPLLMLLDGCGDLRVAVQNPLDETAAEALVTEVAGLDAAPTGRCGGAAP